MQSAAKPGPIEPLSRKPEHVRDIGGECRQHLFEVCAAIEQLFRAYQPRQCGLPMSIFRVSSPCSLNSGRQPPPSELTVMFSAGASDAR